MRQSLVLPTLYKRSSNGAVQQWSIKAVPDQDTYAAVITKHGQVGGAMQESIVCVRKGKNVGRSNETNCLEQAKLEARSKWNKQKDKGYSEEQNATRPEKKPMLAQDYASRRDKVKFPALIQPKLDGMRGVAIKENGVVRIMSRGNKEVLTLPHINTELARIMRDGEVWDGELYVHGVPMQKTISWIKRVQEDTARIRYHVYDCIEDCPFELRYFGVEERIGDYYDSWLEEKYEPGIGEVPFPPIARMQTRSVYSHEDVKKFHDEFVQEGYEGAMLRIGDCPYREGYRSYDLLKVKEFLEDDFEIVGVEQGKGKAEGMAVFKLRTAEDAIFDCMPRGEASERRRYWQDRVKLIGKMLTVRFFEWTASDPKVPRFPVGVIVRDYE